MHYKNMFRVGRRHKILYNSVSGFSAAIKYLNEPYNGGNVKAS